MKANGDSQYIWKQSMKNSCEVLDDKVIEAVSGCGRATVVADYLIKELAVGYQW